MSHAISEKADMQEVVVHTGQHYDANMSDVFFTELGMRRPDYNLEIGGGGHGQMTGRMLAEFERVMLDERPDIVLVYGDTNSTLAGALSAVKLHIPVAHVEAGLRSFNMKMPEEINRILTDRISSWLFTPTEAAACHLRSEGMDEASIISVGDVTEAFFHSVPCVTLRDETEWVELVEAGWNHLVSFESVSCVAEAVVDAVGSRGSRIAPYGDGTAVHKISCLLAGLS
jgi:UDP-N-acetylglucosamine 2-epimerase